MTWQTWWLWWMQMMWWRLSGRVLIVAEMMVEGLAPFVMRHRVGGRRSLVAVAPACVAAGRDAAGRGRRTTSGWQEQAVVRRRRHLEIRR